MPEERYHPSKNANLYFNQNERMKRRIEDSSTKKKYFYDQNSTEEFSISEKIDSIMNMKNNIENIQQKIIHQQRALSRARKKGN